jgi:hypothetical protein
MRHDAPGRSALRHLVKFFFDQHDGAGHIAYQLLIVMAKQKVLDMPFLVGRHDEQVDIFLLDHLYDLIRGVAFFQDCFDSETLCFFSFNDLINVLPECLLQSFIFHLQRRHPKVSTFQHERIMHDMNHKELRSVFFSK